VPELRRRARATHESRVRVKLLLDPNLSLHLVVQLADVLSDSQRYAGVTAASGQLHTGVREQGG